MCKILCPKCLEITQGTKHHIFPKRFFGNGDSTPLLYLCRHCHSELEKIIPQFQQLEKEDYLQLTREFLTIEV
jgi:hypothetical protein